MSCCMANLENHIAWRYLFSKKGHNAIDIVSGISAAAVMVVTAAMVCVLSVMNGFGVLVERMFSEFDPALMVVPAEGTTLRTDTAPIVSLYAREDIEAVSMQLEQTALIRYKDHQLPARVMGVDSLFEQTAHIDSIITDGFYSVWDGAFERAVLGRGLAAQIGINAHFTGALHLYAPRRTERINLMRPDLSLLHEHAFIAGTFAVNQIDYDDQLMIVSLPLAQRLFEYDEHTASALRIAPREGVKISNLQSQIEKTLGPGYRVLDRYEQQADFFRILKIEKLLTVLLLVFILLIALFNSIGSLSMLIIDKREDIRILSDLGADEATIRRIFRALVPGAAAFRMAQVRFGRRVYHLRLPRPGSGSRYRIGGCDCPGVGFCSRMVSHEKNENRMKKVLYLLSIIAFALSSCKPFTPAVRQEFPVVYDLAYQEIYGHFYDSVPYAVVALDLYSEGLTLNKDHKMEGTGYNLYLSDIFVPDSLLEEGEYHSIQPANQPAIEPFTFLAGRDYEGTPHGMYILSIGDGKVASIQVLDSGSFVYRGDSLLFTLYYRNSRGEKCTYRPVFGGSLLPYNPNNKL